MSRAEAEAKLAEILHPQNMLAGQSVIPIYTFGQFIELIYLPVYHRKWKPSTAVTAENRLKANLVPELGSLLMPDISREALQNLLDSKANTQATRMVSHFRFRLRSIFDLAMSEGVVDRNPAMALYTPRHCQPSRPHNVLTLEEAGKMLTTLDFREMLIAHCATWEGMRPGEILALQVGEVESNCVWVRRRLYRGQIDTPKSKR